MRAILVSVDYADLLAVTLPYNRHHFDDVMVVTSRSDEDTVDVALQNDSRVFATDIFYEPPAVFNKWKALEQGLDAMGRNGWLCLIDADMLWPKQIGNDGFEVGYLYSPLCYIADLSHLVPPESQWSRFPLRRNQTEWAGYTQIFHATDPHLGKPPWHETNWKHAGGADSFFQRKWPKDKKVRPGWKALHIGPDGRNWCGRVTPYLDGSLPPGGPVRREQLQQFMRGRSRLRGESVDPYAHEKY